MTGANSARFHIVDGSGYIFRAYFALQQQRAGGRNVKLTTSSGMPTGALSVFSSMLMRLYLDEKPDLCAVVFDADGKTFRHEIDPGYKANRREPPEDLIPQFPWFEKIALAFHLPVLRVPGVEADDVISTLTRRARAAGLDVVIYSGDKDLMQLVDDHVTIVDTMRDVHYDPERVREKFGVPPARVADWLALRGDPTDNVPGVEGVGEVTATKLLAEFGSIDGILANVDKLKGRLAEKFRDPIQLERLERSRKLVRLRDDVPLAGDIMSFRRRDWDARELARIFETLEFSRLAARLDAVFVPDRDRYRTILDEAELDALLAKVRENGELGLDTETTSLQAPEAKLVGISIATPGAPPSYIPVGHRYLGAPRQLDVGLVIEKLRPILEDPSIVKYDQNHKYEWVIFARFGIDLRGVRCDPMIASFLLDPTAAHGLDALAKAHLNHETIRYEDVTGRGKEQKGFDEVDVASATRYAAEDADVAFALGKRLRARVEQAGLARLMDEVETPLGRILAIMERNGIRVDTAQLRALGQKVGEQCLALEQEIQRLAGYPVNVLSPKQLGELLYERLGLRSDRMRRTKTGGFSTDAEQLEELVSAHPIVKPILEHRELVKLKGTYLDALPPLVNPDTGRIHTHYSQVGAYTGRIASQNPNIQNIPIRTALGREIRRAFVAEPGWKLVSCDYSQIELRVVAHLSKDPVLCDAFARDVDVHAQTAAEVFGIPLAEVTAEHRRVAKAVNYGLGYGQTDYGLARALDIPREEARRYIEAYFARFAGVREFMEAQLAEARRANAVSTILGRRIPVSGLSSKRYAERTAAERVVRNAPIQGSAADILKLAMIRVQRLLESGEFAARMLLTVHDELVFEVRADQAEDFAARARAEMEKAVELAVPLRVDVGIAESWADAH